ncbi:MAG: hypothetical protein EBR82_26580 [Caulobacteraceae bacterium]|nr:hypothetical protein [Caulobacteraceae bacterium]
MNINQIQMAISLLPVAYVIAMAVPVMVIDIKQNRVPNKAIIPLLLLTLLCWLTLAIWQGKWAELGLSILMSLCLFSLGICLNYIDWIGMGDAKCMAILGLIIAWFSIPASLVFPLVIVALVLVSVLALLFLDAIGLIDISRFKVVLLYPSILIAFGFTMLYLMK